MVMRTVRLRRKEASKSSVWLVKGKFTSQQRGLMLLLPQNFFSVAGGVQGFVAFANWGCLCSVQRWGRLPSSI